MGKRIQPHVMDIQQTDWEALLQQPPAGRPGYIGTEEQVQFAQIAAQLLGTHADIDAYWAFLYDLRHSTGAQLLSGQLDKTISGDRLQALQRVLTIHQEEQGLSVNRLLAFLEGERLLPRTKHACVDQHIRLMLKETLQHFAAVHEGGLLHADFRRVLTDLVKWSLNHVAVWAEGIPENMPRLLWYGNASKSESYFLYFLIRMGWDVLLFHPEGTDVLTAFKTEQPDLASVSRYPATAPLQPFPEARPVRQSTVAFRASQEIDLLLHTEDSMLYKPWQFRMYTPLGAMLNTTYDELFLLAKEKAFIRPGFQAVNGAVHIPSLFAKVAGVPENRRRYWTYCQMLSTHELALTIRSFPFTETARGNPHYHYQRALDAAGRLDPERMLQAHWWSYRDLPAGLQKGVAAAISRYCGTPELRAEPHESLYDLQLYLFNQAMKIPKAVLDLLQRFDYAQDVPKLILAHGPASGTLTRSDAALLLLLKEIGLDIVMFTPSGRNDIEHFIEESKLQVHWLEKMSLEEEWKEPSLLKGLIQKLWR